MPAGSDARRWEIFSRRSRPPRRSRRTVANIHVRGASPGNHDLRHMPNAATPRETPGHGDELLLANSGARGRDPAGNRCGRRIDRPRVAMDDGDTGHGRCGRRDLHADTPASNHADGWKVGHGRSWPSGTKPRLSGWLFAASARMPFGGSASSNSSGAEGIDTSGDPIAAVAGDSVPFAHLLSTLLQRRYS